jgi:hypothetical protein
MKIFVNLTTFPPRTVITMEFQVKAKELIGDLKTLIQGKLRLRPDRQRLIFRGQVLHDGQTLDTCKIEENSTVHLIPMKQLVDQEGVLPTTMIFQWADITDPEQIGSGKSASVFRARLGKDGLQ